MGFFRHFKSLWRKNFILYRRNWMGSVYEMCCPIFLMLIVLMFRQIFSKTNQDPAHNLTDGYIWYDKNYGSSQTFMGYTIFKTNTNWFSYCTKRSYGPNRTIIALAPSGNAIVEAVKSTLTSDLASYGFTIKTYASRDEIWSTMSSSSYEMDGNAGICFGAVLADFSTNSFQVNMIFDDILSGRSSSGNMPNQQLDAADKYQRSPNSAAWKQYKQGGYTYLQNIFSNAILRNQTGNSNSYVSMIYTPLKSGHYVNDDFATAIVNMWSFFILLIYLPPLYRFVSNSVSEKETKIREAMKVMGLTDAPYWLSWFCYYIIINTIQASIMTIILIPVFEYTNRGYVFLYLWLYGMTMFGYGIFIGSFFSNGKTAAIFATMLFYLTSFLSSVVTDQSISEDAKNTCAFFPAVAVQLAGINMLQFESAGVGLQSSNASELYKNFRFSTCLWMNVVSFFIFLLLGLYLENVLPAAVGVRKPLWYLFTKSYWCGTKHDPEHHDKAEEAKSNESKIMSSDRLGDHEIEQIEVNPEYFEEVPEQLKQKEDEDRYIKISKLKKKFDKGFMAINDLNAEIYEDQIFALLGHNGAGKTTTINVLCGMLAASTGKASIYGYNIKTEMKEVRKMMGICPQHNILFPKLTVKEHLSIFADFKGMTRKEIDEEIEMLLKDLNLKDKQNMMSMNLSGGYKRKLSLGIALVGGSKVVFLDEPSSGMDVTARREMWDMLKKYKNDRIIILTTHYMEEADNLGDRIGIMSHGKMLCCGSPDFLKNKFGEGYNLVVVKENRNNNEQLESFVLNNIPDAQKVSEISSEATFLLPKASSQYFPEFFKKFDREIGNLGISSYGVSMTTLEEVFLKVEGGDKNKDAEIVDQIKKRRTSNLDDENNEYSNYSISKEQIKGGCNIFILHFVALFLKRFIMSKRNFKGFIVDMLIPSLLIIVGFGISTIDFYKSSSQRTLEPSLFPLTQRVIYNTNGISGTSASSVSTLMNYLTPSSDFTLTGATSTVGSTDTTTLENFDDVIYNAAQVSPLDPFRYGHYYLYSLDFTNHQYKVVSFINNTSQDAPAAIPHFMYQAILRNVKGSSFSYKMVNDPMPIVQIYKNKNKQISGYFITFVLGIALALIPSSIMGFILYERVNSLVHQQIISGMNKLSYWLTNFLYDIIKAFVPCIVAIIFIYIFDLSLDFAWLLLLLLPTALVPYTYLTSFIFNDEVAAQNFTIIHNFLIGGLLPIVMEVLRLISSTQKLGDGLIWLPRFIPVYNTCCGIISISLKDTIATTRSEASPDALSFKVAGGDVMFLVLEFFVYSFLLFCIEMGFCACLRKKGKHIIDAPEQLDDDVLKEQQKVENTSESHLAVKANHLRKVYDKTVAVKNVSFGLEFGDCFALLGVNGAGKTTTFKMLTNEIVPTEGNSHIVGHHAKKQFTEARKQIGYCPQFDAIFNLLTVREHLEFYSRIKKIPKHLVEGLIQNQLKSMNLEMYENKIAGTLSGGNKRKLSVAMAMIGNPPVVFLDEPSAGMDPKARRFMWNIISKISTRGKNSAVILTTHSMEEAEALSTNMGIMVDGQFKCFGSKQHIKNKFGTGYQVEIKFRMPQTQAVENQVKQLGIMDYLKDKHASSYKIENKRGVEVVLINKEACECLLMNILNNQQALSEFKLEGFGKDIIELLEMQHFYPLNGLLKWEYVMRHNLEAINTLLREFGSALLLEQYTPRYRYRVPKGDKSVGFFFSFMEELKGKLDIDEYSASQTTLEQIFNGFARLEEVGAVKREFQLDPNSMRNLGPRLEPNSFQVKEIED